MPNSSISRLRAPGRLLRCFRSICFFALGLLVFIHGIGTLLGQSIDFAFNPNMTTPVNGIGLQADGKMLIVGGFGIARLNADGSRDTTFSTSTDRALLCVAVLPNGKCYAGGELGRTNGVNRRIVLLNSDGSSDPSFTWTGPSGQSRIRVLAATPDGKVVVGGDFNNPVRLTALGAIDPTFNAVTNGFCRVLCVQPDGKVLIAGTFTTVGETSRSKIARLNADGTFDPTFNCTLSTFASVYNFAIQADGKIFIAGDFSSVNSISMNGVARINPDGALDPTFINPGVNGITNSLVVQTDGKILIAGSFTNVGGVARDHIARLHPNGSRDATFNTVVDHSNSGLLAVGQQGDGRVFISGNVSPVEGQERGEFVRLLNDPVTLDLSVTRDGSIQWTRDGAAPETLYVDFELSTDNQTWQPIGAATRLGKSWTKTGVSLPGTGRIRALAYLHNGNYTGSSARVSQVQSFDFVTETPTLTQPLAGALLGRNSPINFNLPEAALPGSVKVAFDNGVDPPISLTLAAGIESNGGHAFSFDPRAPTTTADIQAGAAIPDGVYSVKLSYQDALGNPAASSIIHQNITIDTTAPTIFVPETYTVEATSAAGAIVELPLSAEDANDPAPVITSNPTTGTLFQIGATNVEVTVRDSAGNISTRNFNVVVSDTTAPTVTGTYTPLVLVTGPTGAAALPDYLSSTTATDVVGVTSLTQEPPADSPRLAGTTHVTITAKDAAGNAKDVAFDVTVLDGTKPEIGAPENNFAPLTIITGVDSAVPLPNYTAQAITSDNVGVTQVTQSPEPGSARIFGTTTVTLTAHDLAGNTRSFSFDVDVQDGTKPTIAAPVDGFTPLGITTGVDGTVALPDYTGQAVTSDNVAVTTVTQSPLAASAQVAGVTTVTLTAHDAAGNTISTTFEVAVADGTKPEIAAPASGFTPLPVVAGEDGTAPLPDYTTQAVTSDNVGVTGVTQIPAPGDVRLFGKTGVTLTALDAAGNTREMRFDVFVTLDAPLVNTLAGIGTQVPGAGTDPRIPGDATFTSLGLPVVDDTRNLAFLGKWKSSSGPGIAIFAGDPLALVVKVGEDAPGLSGVQFKTLQDPLIAPDGTVTFAATLKGQGIKAGNDFSVWIFSEEGPVMLLREGTQVPGAPTGTLLKSVSGLSFRDGELLVLGKLALGRGVVTAGDDSVLLSVTANGGKILFREGSPVDLQDGKGASAIKKIETLLPAEGSSAHGRWHADGGAIARVTLADKRVAIVQAMADGTVVPHGAIGASALDSTASWKVLGMPAVEPSGEGLVLKGQLKAQVVSGQQPTVTNKNDTVLALDVGDGAGLKVFAREGATPTDAGGTAYASFLDPVINANKDVLFGAALVGSGVTAKNKTALFSGDPDSPFILARSGSPVPDTEGNLTGALWSKFISYALPSGPDAGPIFTATVVGPGVTAKTNVGLWAVDSTGLLRQLLRTGDIIGGKAITGIHALSGVTGSLGASRGFNERGTVVTRVSFAKGGQAILRIDIPEGQVRITSRSGVTTFQLDLGKPVPGVRDETRQFHPDVTDNKIEVH